MSYTIEEHQHRFAAWAASRASQRGIRSFSVKNGKEILNAFRKKFGSDSEFSLKDLPTPKEVDNEHEKWRKYVMKSAKDKGVELSHGVAAKLINCYLKARFVCGGFQNDERVKRLHPPIDSVLLKKLASKDVGGHAKEWRKYDKRGWSNFNSDEYKNLINLIRNVLGNEPLWKIEEYWDGHQ